MHIWGHASSWGHDFKICKRGIVNFFGRFLKKVGVGEIWYQKHFWYSKHQKNSFRRGITQKFGYLQMEKYGIITYQERFEAVSPFYKDRSRKDPIQGCRIFFDFRALIKTKVTLIMEHLKHPNKKTPTKNDKSKIY